MAGTLLLPVLIFGGLAMWYWAVPIGRWLSGDAPPAEPTVASEPEMAQQAAPMPTPDPPPEPAVEKVFGIRGAPDGSEPEPAQADVPVQAAGSKIEAVSTNVRGNVGSTAVSASLDKLDTTLASCWAEAGASGSVELELSFGITPDGGLHAIALSGGSEALQACVRAAVPMSGWPGPQVGEASVSRTWKLGG